MEQKSFLRSVISIAIPVALQSMLQSSFSMIDQVMVGQLGSASIAAIGIAGKFSFIYGVMQGAVATIAGIMISQYIGQKNSDLAKGSLSLNLLIAIALGFVFTAVSVLIPGKIMGLYSEDTEAINEAAAYLRIIAVSFVPMGVCSALSVMLRCNDRANLPLYASIVSALTNTALNYVLIFGKLGAPEMGVRGAAIASLFSQLVNLIIVYIMVKVTSENRRDSLISVNSIKKLNMQKYIVMLSPILLTGFLWSLGQNVFTLIYAHIGTKEMAAIALVSPLESLLIGALSGLAQAAGILIGKRLGEGEIDKAYSESKKLLIYGALGSVLLSLLLLVIKGAYIRIYNVEDYVKQSANMLLIAFAVLAPFKVENMIISNGILRSGGKTNYIMIIDQIGTWGVGVPLGFLSAYYFSLPIAWVYFIIGLEECVRYILCLLLFRSKKWIVTL